MKIDIYINKLTVRAVLQKDSFLPLPFHINPCTYMHTRMECS